MYRENNVYRIMEKLITSAGVEIIYQEVPNDHIDGAIWARSDIDSRMIMMPDKDVFGNDETACLILGHEMGHILANVDSPDVPAERRKNEAICDLIENIEKRARLSKNARETVVNAFSYDRWCVQWLKTIENIIS